MSKVTAQRFTPLRDLVGQAEQAVLASGLSPSDAATMVGDPQMLNAADLRLCVERTIAASVHGRLARMRTERRSDDLDARTEEAFDKLQLVTIKTASALARVFYADVDGVERNLLSLSLDGLRRRLASSETEEAEARLRREFFAAAIAACEVHKRRSLGTLPQAVLYDIAIAARQVWGE